MATCVVQSLTIIMVVGRKEVGFESFSPSLLTDLFFFFLDMIAHFNYYAVKNNSLLRYLQEMFLTFLHQIFF